MMRPSRDIPQNSRLGVGVVWWPELDPLCDPREGLVHVIEAEPETFWLATGADRFVSRLAEATRHLTAPRLLHGVGAPFGGTVGQSPGHLATLKADIAATRPAWISDHLTFNQYERGADTVCAGFLLPPAQSHAGVLQAARQIRDRRIATGVPVAFENPVNYLPPHQGDMPDGEFFAAVAETADCGILLDLHNALCNERNGRQSVRAFLDALPLDRVWEIHLAGGQMERGFWLDAHSGVAEPALLDLLHDVLPRLPALRAVILEIMPEFVAPTGLGALATSLGRINDIWSARAHPAGQALPAPPALVRPDRAASITPAMWERAIGDAVTGLDGAAPPADLTPWLKAADGALALYRYLAGEARASALVDTAPRSIRLLLVTSGEAETRAVLGRFWRRHAPGYTSIEEAGAFLDFLTTADITIPGLHDAVVNDRAGLRQLAAAVP